MFLFLKGFLLLAFLSTLLVAGSFLLSAFMLWLRKMGGEDPNFKKYAKFHLWVLVILLSCSLIESFIIIFTIGENALGMISLMVSIAFSTILSLYFSLMIVGHVFYLLFTKIFNSSN